MLEENWTELFQLLLPFTEAENRIEGKNDMAATKEQERKEVRKLDIERMISKFRKQELEEELKAKKREKQQVNINPDSLVGKEIKYQTALLHEILNETRKQTRMLENKKRIGE